MLKNVSGALVNGSCSDYSLFMVAFHYAESGKNVWFISSQPFTKVPTSLAVPHKEVLQLITFLYLKDHKDLITHLNGIHLWQTTPNVIIVKGFENYAGINMESYNSSLAALVITSLLDSAATCSNKKNEKAYVITTCMNLPEEYNSRIKLLVDLYFLKFIQVNDENVAVKEILKYFDACEFS